MIKVTIEASFASAEVEVTETCVVRQSPETMDALLEETARLAVGRAQRAFAPRHELLGDGVRPGVHVEGRP